MGQSLHETSKIAGAFTFKVQPKSKKGPHSTNVEFLNVDLQGPDAGTKPHYHLQYTNICVDSHDPSSFSTVQQPFDTFGFIGHSNSTKVGMTSGYTRYQHEINSWNQDNIAKWTYFRSDRGFLSGLNLPTDSFELPIVEFHHPGQKNKGIASKEMSVKLSSLWKVKNKGVEVRDWKTSIFSFFSRKKMKAAEPVPIYTNFVPCVVIDFQPEALKLGWTFERRTLLLPVDADTTQKEQSGALFPPCDLFAIFAWVQSFRFAVWLSHCITLYFVPSSTGLVICRSHPCLVYTYRHS